MARSDSKAALGALSKERSNSRSVNLVARELSFDLAELGHEVEVEFRHLPKDRNEWADALSRLAEPGGNYSIPAELKYVPRKHCATRDLEWWRTRGLPTL